MSSLITYITTLLASIAASIAHKYNAVVYSGMPIFFWVRPRWSVEEMPDQTGKVVIVTGGNSGTGYSTCKALYQHGATVYMASRSRKNAEEAIEAIDDGGEYGLEGVVYSKNGRGVGQNVKGKGKLVFLELDLADLGSIEKFVEEFLKREEKLDLLFANAGVMASPRGLYTKQGYTLQFGTNCLGHHRLINLLLPILLKSSSKTPTDPSRIIITSSAGHSTAPTGGIDRSSVMRLSNPIPTIRINGTSGHSERKLTPGKNELMAWVEYGQSKWGNIACAKWLDRVYGPRSLNGGNGRSDERIAEGELISVAVHPGCVATQLARHLPLTPFILKWCAWMVPVITMTPTFGASNQLWAATCPVSQARTLSGEYVVPFQRIGIPRPDLNDVKLVSGIWDWLNDLGTKGV